MMAQTNEKINVLIKSRFQHTQNLHVLLSFILDLSTHKQYYLLKITKNVTVQRFYCLMTNLG